MARRRLNTKVFAILTAVLVVGGAAVVAAQKYAGRTRGDPKAMEAEGDAMMEKRDYEQAQLRYAAAADRDPSNPALRVKLGEAYVKLTRDDPINLGRAHRAWNDAIAVDPAHKPALEKLLKSLWEQIEMGGGGARAEVFAEVRQRADQLAKADPQNAQAKVWRHVATVRQSLAGQGVPPDEVAASTEELADLAAKNPANAEPPYYLALDRLKAVRDRLSARAPVEAEQAAKAAAGVMAKALAGQDGNAQMQYRAALVFWQLGRLDPRAAERPKHIELANACIAKAAAVVDKSSPDLADIILTASDALNGVGKRDEAKAMVRKFYEENPNNQPARLAWARWQSGTPEGRVEAMKLLSQEVPLPADAVGVGVIAHREQQAQTVYELVRMRLTDADAVTKDAGDRQQAIAREVEKADPARRAAAEAEMKKVADAAAARRKQIAADVDADMARLRKLASVKAPRVLALEGQVLLFKNQPIEAVKAMEEAYAGMPGGQKDWELVYRLAHTHAKITRQPGLARKLAEELVSVGTAPQGLLAAARVLLAEQLVFENRLAAAEEQVLAIEKASKDHPDIARLRSAIVMRQGNKPGSADGVLARMLEADNAQRRQKTDYAGSVGKPDEQIRLLNLILRDDPKDVEAVRLLASLYKQRQMPDRAKQVVESGLLASPDNATLQLVQAELNGATPDQMREKIRAEIQKVPDPYDQAMRMYSLERAPGGSPEAALRYLVKAAEARPDDVRAREALFQEYLSRGREKDDAARAQLAKLVELNADQFGGRLYRHRFAVARKDFAEAERVGLDLVTTFPEFAQSWLALGQAQDALGKWPEAIRSYTEVLARQPVHYEATRLLVDALYNAGRTDEAEARLRDMRAMFPADPTGRELYLNHMANFGKPQAAIPDREEMLKKAPNDPWSYLALAATYFKNAQRLAAENKLDASRADIEKAFATLSQGREKFQDDTRFYAQVAEIHQYNGRGEQGEAVLTAYAERELTRPPPAKVRPDPWLALADFYARASQIGRAADAMSQALARADDKDKLDLRLRLAAVQVQARQFADAQATLDAVRDNPDPRVARQRVELLVARHSMPEAEREIKAILATRDAADLRNLMASVLIDTDRPAEAIPHLQRALELEPTNEAARYLRALALVKKRPPETEAAINELVDLKKSANRNMQVRLLLAELYDKTGRRALAIQDLDDALQKAPGNRDVRLALVRLYRGERPARVAEAKALIEAAEKDPVLKTDPTWPREIAMLAMQQRQYQPAVLHMSRAVQLAPANIEFRRELVDMLLQFNDLGGALAQTDKLMRDGQDAWWLRQQRGLAFGKQVTRQMLDEAKGNPDVAKEVANLQSQSLAEFDKAIALAEKENDDERVVGILRVLGQTVGNDQALRRVGPRLANDPTNRWRMLAISLKRAQGDIAGAIADAERLLAEPANATANPERRGPILRALADTYQNQAQPDLVKARARYGELLKLVPNDIVSLNNIAYLLAESIQPPDPQAAKVYSERAFDLTRNSNDPSALILDTHGWVLVLCGGEDFSRGLQILKNVVEQNPLFVEGRYHLGEALLNARPAGPAQAEKEFTECLRIMDEEEKVGGNVDQKLRGRIQVGLSKARELAKGG